MRRKGRGEIVKVGDLFAIYKQKLRAPEGTVIDTAQEVIKDLFDFEIPKERMQFNTTSKTLVIQTSGPLKTEITLKKKEILLHLKGRLGAQNAPKEIL